jgi:hypothetical protein
MHLKPQFYLKIIAGLFLSTALFFGLERLCHKATDGFALTRMTNPLPSDEEFQTPKLSDEESKQMHMILSQPFYYLSCGGQSYVFISEDGQYILKFNKFHHLRIPSLIKHLPLPASLDQYRTKKIQKKDFILRRTLRSYVVAYRFLKQETGMLYYHLQKTSDLNQTLTFFDKLGYKYTINLDDYAFVVQKKGMATRHMINALMQEGKTIEAQEKLDQLLRLAVVRCQKGLGDRDFKFKSNLGFIDGIAAQIDLGSLSLDEHAKEPTFYKAEIKRAGGVLRAWLMEEHPTLVTAFDASLEKICAS